MLVCSTSRAEANLGIRWSWIKQLNSKKELEAKPNDTINYVIDIDLIIKFSEIVIN